MTWRDFMPYAVYPNEVKVLIGGKEYPLEIRTDSRGEPYLVEKTQPAPFDVSYYMVCRSTPKIQGSSSETDMLAYTKDEDEAFRLLADGRNDLRRFVLVGEGKDSKMVCHWWNSTVKRWRDENGNIV